MFKQLPTDEILVGERFRKDYGPMVELVDSIIKFGIIEPLVIDSGQNLIAGGRRLRAAKTIGLLTVPCVLRDEVDEITSREIELEENIQRQDLTWLEKCLLTQEIDRLKRVKYGSAKRGADGDERWSDAKTAVSIDQSKATVSRDLAAARLVEIIPSLADCTSREEAVTVADRMISQLERVLSKRKWMKEGGDSDFHLGDCLAVLKEIPDQSVDCVITDPPYGTDASDGMREFHFDDSPITALDTLTAVVPELQRVLKPGGHVYCFFGIKVWKETMWIFSKAFGGAVDPIPLVWTKDTSGLCDFTMRYANAWEPILFVNTGRPIANKSTNVLRTPGVPGEDKITPVEKPCDLIQFLIEQSTQPGEVVLDPFAGSGSTIVAAIRSDRRYIGIEQNQEFWERASIRILEEKMSSSNGSEPKSETVESWDNEPI